MNVTVTAQAVNQAVLTLGQLGGMPWQNILAYLVIGLVGLLASSVVSQHVIEALIAKFKPPFYVKAFMPTIWSAVIGLVLKSLGTDSQTAAAAAVTLAGLIHTVNESPIAADLESKFPAIKAAVDVVGQAAKVSIILIGLLLLGAVAKADVMPPATAPGFVLGPSLGGGSALYTLATDGLAPQQSAVAWASYDAFYGRFTGQVFSPFYVLGILGGIQTSNNLTHPVAGARAGWIANGVPVTAFIAWPLDQGNHAPIFGLGSSFQFDYIPGLDFAFGRPSI